MDINKVDLLLKFILAAAGQEDYSLRVENRPKAPPKTGQLSLFAEEVEP